MQKRKTRKEWRSLETRDRLEVTKLVQLEYKLQEPLQSALARERDFDEHEDRDLFDAADVCAFGSLRQAGRRLSEMSHEIARNLAELIERCENKDRGKRSQEQTIVFRRGYGRRFGFHLGSRPEAQFYRAISKKSIIEHCSKYDLRFPWTLPMRLFRVSKLPNNSWEDGEDGHCQESSVC
jgi:hypothetical protein